ncbi:DUF2092 domain-containing protein [bacterium]|nr:DUF2092 domain-containing protein [bacterium]
MKTAVDRSPLAGKRRALPRHTGASLMAIALAVTTLTGCSAPGAGPVEDKADQVLRGMGAKLAAARQMTIRAKRRIDPALVEGRDVVVSAEVSASVKRPDKLAARILGANDERRVYYDGKTFSMLDVKRKLYATVDAPDTIDKLMKRLEEEFGFSPPMADFIARDPYRQLHQDAKAGKYVGEEQVGGKRCHHLAFKEELLDWDLWVSAHDQLPVKFVITATAIEGHPKFGVEFTQFNLEADLPDGLFTFQAPQGAIKVPMARTELDEPVQETP